MKITREIFERAAEKSGLEVVLDPYAEFRRYAVIKETDIVLVDWEEYPAHKKIYKDQKDTERILTFYIDNDPSLVGIHTFITVLVHEMKTLRSASMEPESEFKERYRYIGWDAITDTLGKDQGE